MRGEVYMARLEPVEDSEQAGIRPVVVVSRDSLNRVRRHVVGVPFTSFRDRPIPPSHTLVRAGDGGLRVDSIALTEQVRALAKTRFGRLLGSLSNEAMTQIERSLRIALALDSPQAGVRR